MLSLYLTKCTAKNELNVFKCIDKERSSCVFSVYSFVLSDVLAGCTQCNRKLISHRHSLRFWVSSVLYEYSEFSIVELQVLTNSNVMRVVWIIYCVTVTDQCRQREWLLISFEWQVRRDFYLLVEWACCAQSTDHWRGVWSVAFKCMGSSELLSHARTRHWSLSRVTDKEVMLYI